MSMKKSDLDKLLGKKIGGEMKGAGIPGRFAQGASAVRRPARAAPPRRRRRPRAVRLQAAGRPGQRRCASAPPAHDGGINGLVAELLRKGLGG